MRQEHQTEAPKNGYNPHIQKINHYITPCASDKYNESVFIRAYTVNDADPVETRSELEYK
ncbi:hypothetical protein GCM10010911_70450 [Paenibacillus nasutitermitis]|uniref:Uncharacterized protein n=1 Tax=Paenibacillus nasutitermitis TaxID=1652958 RepID=A0A916ZJQ3_9BACL|nr:hypothetical protein GCM10010911_70450 [Paenibacillus nasutitermitis]